MVSKCAGKIRASFVSKVNTIWDHTSGKTSGNAKNFRCLYVKMMMKYVGQFNILNHKPSKPKSYSAQVTDVISDDWLNLLTLVNMPPPSSTSLVAFTRRMATLFPKCPTTRSVITIHHDKQLQG